MKKLFFLLAVALPCFIFTSCGDDDDDDLPAGNVSISGEINGHAWVDLGLPSGLKWATCNVGSSSPEGYGDYFAWGETTPKSNYSWSTYKYGCDRHELTKYCTKSSFGYNGFTDNKTTLDPSDDAATANWGGAWRMPTCEEQFELRTRCTWTWTTQNGVYGHKVTGPNGNSIFLPAAGYRYNSDLNGAGPSGLYWSSSLYSDYPGSAYYLNFYSDLVVWYGDDRGGGRSVRPVCQ